MRQRLQVGEGLDAMPLLFLPYHVFVMLECAALSRGDVPPVPKADRIMTSIIVTNDDGVHAPGILALAQAMQQLGDVTVSAPATNQSSSGHKKTLFREMAVETITIGDGIPALSVDGSPADSIALASLGLQQWPPDIVVSGINRGENLSQDVTYSGTVTAALEAAIQGVPAVAVSYADRAADTVAAYEQAAQLAVRVVRYVLLHRLPPLTILNLNVPVGPVRGLRLTRQGIRVYRDQAKRNGNRVSIVGEVPTGDVEVLGTDIWAIHQGYASLTPIHLDLTAHHFMAELNAWDIEI